MSRRVQSVLLAVAVVGLASPGTAQDASRVPFQKSEPQAGSNLKAGANSFVESQAKQLLESKGYYDVSTLVNDSDGFWRGTAQKNAKRVDVTVDFQGHIAEK